MWSSEVGLGYCRFGKFKYARVMCASSGKLSFRVVGWINLFKR